MDTGATQSSIDAEIVEVRPADEAAGAGEAVVFTLELGDGTRRTFEREVKRYVDIKKKEGGTIRRPVVIMRFCIADRLVEEEVNLANRDVFVYPVLVGRNMMAPAGLLIDASRTMTAPPACEAE